jgi:exonuclease SbcC
VRADAAAHASADCRPGDPCPICERPLPAGFTAPSAPDLLAAEDAERAASEALGVVVAEERDRALRQSATASTVATATRAVETTHAAYANALQAAARLADVAGTADPVATAAAALDSLERGAAEASGRVEALVAQRAALAASVEERRMEIVRAEGRVDAGERSLASLQEELGSLTSELDASAATLPAPCAIEVAAVEAAAEEIERRLQGARAMEGRRSAAVEAAITAAHALSAAELALQSQVATPAAAMRAELLAVVAADLPDAGLGEPGPDVGPAALAAFAEALEAAVDERVDALRAAAAQAVAARADAERAGQERLAAAGFADAAALVARSDEVRALLLVADRELRMARGQIEGAERLDGLKRRARELQSAFEALKEALADRAFIGFVVARRQRALLVHASRVLEEVTGRYAFTDDFRILDRESGLPRSPDTLSGGETFIASLALALGLVEVADRAGGDLRALFLDEGFGTLDAAVLETAIDALEQRARAGRLIGVISHVPTVAERIETVLEVRQSVDGSAVELLSAAEREERVFDAATTAVSSVARTLKEDA